MFALILIYSLGYDPKELMRFQTIETCKTVADAYIAMAVKREVTKNLNYVCIPAADSDKSELIDKP